MFRARVAAQGFTVIAMVAGSMYYSKDREKTKELRKLKEEHDAEEKRQRWIRELEARDNEEKAMKARLQRRRAPAETPMEDGEGTGGLLGKMGLWKEAEKKAAQDAEAASARESKPRRENSNSSFGAIGEVMGSKKKGDDN